IDVDRIIVNHNLEDINSQERQSAMEWDELFFNLESSVYNNLPNEFIANIKTMFSLDGDYNWFFGDGVDSSKLANALAGLATFLSKADQKYWGFTDYCIGHKAIYLASMRGVTVCMDHSDAGFICEEVFTSSEQGERIAVTKSNPPILALVNGTKGKLIKLSTKKEPPEHRIIRKLKHVNNILGVQLSQNGRFAFSYDQNEILVYDVNIEGQDGKLALISPDKNYKIEKAIFDSGNNIITVSKSLSEQGSPDQYAITFYPLTDTDGAWRELGNPIPSDMWPLISDSASSITVRSQGSDPVSSIAVGPQGLLAVATIYGEIFVWRFDDNSNQYNPLTVKFEKPVRLKVRDQVSMAFSQNGELAVSYGSAAPVRIWKIKGFEPSNSSH
ncbi:MAG: hypothetical protein ACPG5T_07145, partial [Endozoicomonas sp.]